MGLAAVLAAALLFAPTFAEVNTQARSSSGLRGIVMRGPTRPVCMEDDPCEQPAAGVKLQFKRAGRVVAQVKTGAGGAYALKLRPGTYAVTTPQRGIGSGITPRLVKVPNGHFARVNFHLDTGIQ